VMKTWVLAGLLVLLTVTPASWAQEPEEIGDDPVGAVELREAMQRFFENRVRAELSLRDDQMEQLRPLLERLNHARIQAQRERAELARELRRGMQQGAGDAELQGLLDRLESIEPRQRETQREVQGEIDKLLSVRQRIQFRFFAVRFQREVQSRMQLLRNEQMDRRDLMDRPRDRPRDGLGRDRPRRPPRDGRR